MKEELYGWIKNLAVFYILFTAVLHLVPEGKYEKYVRLFMGLLLILMMSSPIFVLLGKAESFSVSFFNNYQSENTLREREETQNLQKLYLERGYELELENKIKNNLKNRGIELQGLKVNIEGEHVSAVLYVKETLSQEQEEVIEDGLREAAGIDKGSYQVKTGEYEPSAVDRTASSGASSGSGSTARIR